MSRLSFATAAARADSALGSVEVTVTCPDCDQPVACTVEGTNVVTVHACADPDVCYGVARENTIAWRAIDRAAAERDGYREHLMDCGQ